jgi:hypothetical protein
METIKFTVAYYHGIGENPMVILLDREVGYMKRQYDTIEDLKADITEEAIIYFVADKEDQRVDDLHNWHGGNFDFDKLSEVAFSEFVPKWKTEFKKIKQCPQRQDSMIDQLIDLLGISEKFGFIDATVYIKSICYKYTELKRIESDYIPMWKAELDKVNQCPVSKDNQTQQLTNLQQIANRFGFYDAADFLKK